MLELLRCWAERVRGFLGFPHVPNCWQVTGGLHHLRIHFDGTHKAEVLLFLLVDFRVDVSSTMRAPGGQYHHITQ